MCTRFVYNGNDTIIGFNFDIDLAVWKHTVIKEKDMFYIGIKMPDGDYHSFHGINKNGNVGTLLYVNGNEKGKYIADQKRVLIIEPGLGYRFEQAKYSLITNYSILSPETTKPYIVSGDDRFERADEQLKKSGDDFSVTEAFNILKSVKQEGLWATRVSFVYSIRENKVYYVLNNDFKHIKKYQFQKDRECSSISKKKVKTQER